MPLVGNGQLHCRIRTSTIFHQSTEEFLISISSFLIMIDFKNGIYTLQDQSGYHSGSYIHLIQFCIQLELTRLVTTPTNLSTLYRFENRQQSSSGNKVLLVFVPWATLIKRGRTQPACRRPVSTVEHNRDGSFVIVILRTH